MLFCFLDEEIKPLNYELIGRWTKDVGLKTLDFGCWTKN